MTSSEQLISIEAPRTPHVRRGTGRLNTLADSIRHDGLRHPIVLWKDGTLLSGTRRHRACLLLGRERIPAVFVDTIEDAAKHLLADNEDDHLAVPMKWSEVCRLWELLRRLDEPAAVQRGAAARRRGVELRRLTEAGKRNPGRSRQHSEDYVLGVLGPTFGMSASTAKRLWAVYEMAYVPGELADDKREQAREALRRIDAGEASIFACYAHLRSGHPAPASPLRPGGPAVPAAARVQRAAWDRSLPQMEGLVAGLAELGPPNAELTWEQVAPVYARLSAVRRDIEKMIKKMREINPS
jgi:hypothetical protein